MEKKMSKRDVIHCRGIWYVMTLLSIFGLSISLNLLWPPGDSSGSSRFLRDGAVSATTFYAVTLLRYLFFADPPDPSTCYKKFTRKIEKFPQLLVGEIAILVAFLGPLWCSVWVKKVPFLSYMSTLFIISLVTGGIGLIQLSDKFRMEMRHALLTLFLVWLFSPFGLFVGLYANDYPGVSFFLLILWLFGLGGLGMSGAVDEDFDPPLPT